MGLDLWREHAFIRNMMSEAVVATAVFFLSALWYRPGDPKHAHIEEFARDLQTPVAREEEIDPGALRVYRLLAWVCLLLGTVLGLCALLPGTAIAPSGINLVAGVMLFALGVLLLRVSRQSKEAGV
jgi:hypothetical protein